MKEKLLKSITIVLALGTILGLGLSINKSYATQANRKQDGQPDLDSYSYKVHTGSFEVKTTTNPWNLMEYGSYQIFCIQPNSALRYTWHKELAEMREHVADDHRREQSHMWGCGGARHLPACDWTYGWDQRSNTDYGEDPPAGVQTGGVLSPIQVKEVGTGDLSDYNAYIVSEDPVGQWSEDKQQAIWNGRDATAVARDGTTLDLDGGLIVGNNALTHTGTPAIQQEGIDYAIYNHDIQKIEGDKVEMGINPVDEATGQGTISYLQSTDEYAVKYFCVNYVDGDFGHIAFAGISDIYVVGYNAKGEPVKDTNGEVKRFDISKINILKDDGETLDRTILASELAFFEPEEENITTGQKTDHTPQNYPKPGEKFEVVYKDPNEGIDYNDEENRVVTVTVKVKFKYMQAKGKYTKLQLTKYQMRDDHSECSGADCSHTHHHYRRTSSGRRVHSGCHEASCTSLCVRKCKIVTLPQQYHMVADAIRAIYEDEIDLVPGGDGDGLTDMTMQIGGRVWMDAAVGKEGMQCNVYMIFKQVRK